MEKTAEMKYIGILIAANKKFRNVQTSYEEGFENKETGCYRN